MSEQKHLRSHDIPDNIKVYTVSSVYLLLLFMIHTEPLSCYYQFFKLVE